MINNKLFEGHNLFTLNLLYYFGEIQFVSDLAREIFHKHNDFDKTCKLTFSFLKYGIENKIFYIESNLKNITNNELMDTNIIYDERNIAAFESIIKEHFSKFLDIENDQVKYSYLIQFTKEWLEELRDLGISKYKP